MTELERKLKSLRIAKKYWHMVEDADIGDGYWITLKEEYCWEDSELHTIHEYTLADLSRCMREVEKVEDMEKGFDKDAWLMSMMIPVRNS